MAAIFATCVVGSVSLLGCAQAGAAKPGPASAKTVVKPTRVPEDRPEPALSSREVRLAGSWRVVGYDSRHALLVHDTHDKQFTNELHLLDLQNGRHTPLLLHPVTRGLCVLGYALGQHWVAWEECVSYDLDRDPRQVVWRLYAAPLGGDPMSAGTPRLVTSGRGDVRTRPQFVFSGDALVCMNDERSTTEAGTGPMLGVVRRYDPATGKSEEILRADTFVRSIGVSGPDLIVNASPSVPINPNAARITVRDVRTGAIRLSYDPPLPCTVVHPPAFHDGLLAWAEAGGATTDVLFGRPGGSLTALTFAGGDVALDGDYVFAEGRAETTESVESRTGMPGSQIYGFHLGRRGRFTLVEGLMAKGQWWQIADPATYHPASLIVYNDRTKLGVGHDTVIRVYDLRSSTTTSSLGG